MDKERIVYKHKWLTPRRIIYACLVTCLIAITCMIRVIIVNEREQKEYESLEGIPPGNNHGKLFRMFTSSIIPPYDRPVYYAIRDNDMDNVKSLLRRGANIYNISSAQENVFLVACRFRRVEILEYLISAEVGIIKPAWRARVWEALFLNAAANGQLWLFEEATKHGVQYTQMSIAEIPIIDWALWLAAENWRAEAVQWLIQRGANPNQPNPYNNIAHLIPHQRGIVHSTEFRYMKNATLRSIPDFEKLIDLLYPHESYSSSAAWYGYTPLRQAIYTPCFKPTVQPEKQIETVQILIQAGAQLDTGIFVPNVDMFENVMPLAIRDVLDKYFVREQFANQSLSVGRYVQSDTPTGRLIVQ